MHLGGFMYLGFYAFRLFIYLGFYAWLVCGYLWVISSPRIPREHNKYHGYTQLVP